MATQIVYSGSVVPVRVRATNIHPTKKLTDSDISSQAQFYIDGKFGVKTYSVSLSADGTKVDNDTYLVYVETARLAEAGAGKLCCKLILSSDQDTNLKWSLKVNTGINIEFVK